MFRKYSKAQSSMEYIVTYGWAISLVMVALGALFYLGVFNGATTLGNSCLPTAGYLCQSPALSTNGLLTVTFGQSTGQTFYNIEVACASTSNNPDQVPNSVLFSTVGYNGAANPATDQANVVNSLTLLSSDYLMVSQLQCYSNGASIAPIAIGSQYTGFLWINYTENACTSAPCDWLTIKAAKLNLKVV